MYRLGQTISLIFVAIPVAAVLLFLVLQTGPRLDQFQVEHLLRSGPPSEAEAWQLIKAEFPSDYTSLVKRLQRTGFSGTTADNMVFEHSFAHLGGLIQDNMHHVPRAPIALQKRALDSTITALDFLQTVDPVVCGQYGKTGMMMFADARKNLEVRDYMRMQDADISLAMLKAIVAGRDLPRTHHLGSLESEWQKTYEYWERRFANSEQDAETIYYGDYASVDDKKVCPLFTGLLKSIRRTDERLVVDYYRLNFGQE